ncbi:alpha/beta fold hydrolase [Desulfocurvibacter africanus]|uniref:Putative esterase n=1 Tax=Desulfocurvibacter africanus subsp. africanus str. Walvis Bay TaxID=690850 RepID=F3Z237_DESAF|nr:alpha/beta hydrolase [Desulfocurvibacter africanus]EGJ51246.1 putative esterase [Desulfocurvibacter africanus subsp. africanus str. Walvis Bay]
MSIFVLLHGAFQGGWVWQDVEAALCRIGHDVHAPTLTGSGNLAYLLNDKLGLDSAIDDAAGLFFYQDLRAVTLVCHSWSGMLAPAVAGRLPDRVRRIVFVDAVLPEPGKSFADLAGPEFQAMLDKHIEGWLVRPWPLPVFGMHCEERKRWFSSRINSFPLKAFTDPFTGPGQPEWPACAYIRCLETPMPFLKNMAARARTLGFAYREIESGHSPMTTAPDRLAEILSGLAGPTNNSAAGSPGQSGRPSCTSGQGSDELRRLHCSRRKARAAMAPRS